jgi:hypothetical protein
VIIKKTMADYSMEIFTGISFLVEAGFIVQTILSGVSLE